MNVTKIIDKYTRARGAAYKAMEKALIGKYATCTENGEVTRQGKILKIWTDDRGEFSELLLLIEGNVNPVGLSFHYHHEDTQEVTIDD